MGKKQITKTIRQKTQRVERLVSLGQPVLKEHTDKYADKAEATRNYRDVTEQKRNENNNNTPIAERPQLESDYQKELSDYRSNITLFSDRVYDSTINGNYNEGLNFIKKLKGLLKRDLFERLRETEKDDIKDTIYCLENLCLAKATPSLNEQFFYWGEDLIYLKENPNSRYNISQRELERFYKGLR